MVQPCLSFTGKEYTRQIEKVPLEYNTVLYLIYLMKLASYQIGRADNSFFALFFFSFFVPFCFVF